MMLLINVSHSDTGKKRLYYDTLENLEKENMGIEFFNTNFYLKDDVGVYLIAWLSWNDARGIDTYFAHTTASRLTHTNWRHKVGHT